MLDPYKLGLYRLELRQRHEIIFDGYKLKIGNSSTYSSEWHHSDLSFHLAHRATDRVVGHRCDLHSYFWFVFESADHRLDHRMIALLVALSLIGHVLVHVLMTRWLGERSTILPCRSGCLATPRKVGRQQTSGWREVAGDRGGAAIQCVAGGSWHI